MCILRKSKKAFHTLLKTSWKPPLSFFSTRLFFSSGDYRPCVNTKYLLITFVSPGLLDTATPTSAASAAALSMECCWALGQLSAQLAALAFYSLSGSPGTFSDPSTLLLGFWCLQPKHLHFTCTVFKSLQKWDTQIHSLVLSLCLKCFFAINPWAGERRVYQGRY